MAQLVANKYAVALFEIVKEGDTDSLCQEAEAIYNALINEPNFLDTLLNPRISSEEKFQIVQKSFDGASPTILGFFEIILKKNRETEMLRIFQNFFELVEEFKGIVRAEVYTASPLSEEQLNKIKSSLEDKTKKQIKLTVKEDDSLIGGLRISANGFMFDSSVKKQLADMRTMLLG